MARHAKIRANYQADARFLETLISAIERDPKPTVEWRRKVTLNLREVVIMFQQFNISLMRRQMDKDKVAG